MDELDELLVPSHAEDGRREQVWLKTAGVLRRRRWFRRGRIVVALAACYAAGVASMHYWPASRQSLREVASAPVKDPSQPKSPVDPYQNDTPHQIERWAGLADGKKRLVLYRRAGDGFLSRGQEVSALRCYKQALDLGGPAALAVREEDTWLMMQMKIARQREKN